MPKDLTVVVKKHPLYKNIDYKLHRFGRFIDITNRPFLNKGWLYENMKAMFVINSTSILEALLFNGRVFAYGRDIFLNKGIVDYEIRDQQKIEHLIQTPQSTELCEKFISFLLERQINRQKSMQSDLSYIDSHYWNYSI